MFKKPFKCSPRAFGLVVAVAVLSLGVGVWILYVLPPEKAWTLVPGWRARGRPIPGWKEDQDSLRRTWKIVYDPPVEGVTDVFFANGGGGIPGLPGSVRNTILAWRKGGQAYLKTNFLRSPYAAGATVLDLSDGDAIDGRVLDNLLSMQASLDALSGRGIPATDQPRFNIYIKRGTSESKYALYGEMLLLAPPAVPNFGEYTRDLWAAPPAK
jgi:hypothetical protein